MHLDTRVLSTDGMGMPRMSTPSADRSDELRRVDDAVRCLVGLMAKVAADEMAAGSPKTKEADGHEDDTEKHLGN